MSERNRNRGYDPCMLNRRPIPAGSEAVVPAVAESARMAKPVRVQERVVPDIASYRYDASTDPFGCSPRYVERGAQ